MSTLIRNLLNAVAKFFLGILGRGEGIPLPTPSPTPEPTPLPHPVEPPKPGPVLPPIPPVKPSPFTQSQWWHGYYAVTLDWGCTDFTWEDKNPFHPECAHFHEGMDFALPMRTPVYAGYQVTVVGVDVPGYLGANALHLALGSGKPENHDVWLYHMDQVLLHVGHTYPKGTLIGYSGNKGKVTGPHLHFEVRPHNAAYFHSVDPRAVITGKAPR